MLTVRTFDGLRIGWGGQQRPVTGPPAKLFGLLLRHCGSALRRDEIAERLWPESAPGKSRRCLSTVIWRLKGQLPDQAGALIQERAESIALRPGPLCLIDSILFERRIAAQLRLEPHALDRRQIIRLERALAIYRGDFLAGLEEDWLLGEQQRLRNLFLAGMQHLALHQAARGQWRLALITAERVLAHEPLCEQMHRLVMNAHVNLGNRALALIEYDQFRERLHSQLGVRPMQETRELLSRINEPSCASVPVQRTIIRPSSTWPGPRPLQGPVS